MAGLDLKKGEKVDKENMVKLTTQGTQSITELRLKAKQIINDLVEQKTEIINKNDGRVAIISGDGRNKILSGEALKKSRLNGFTKEEHFKASEHIKELFENAKHYTNEQPRNQSADIKHYPKYISTIQINGKDAQAFLTLKELIQHGNRIYSLELQELRPLL